MSAALYSLSRMRTSVAAGRCRASEAGAALRTLRLDARVTQTALAQRLGTTQSAVARLEAGRTRVSVQYLERVAEALGCELQIVFDRTAV